MKLQGRKISPGCAQGVTLVTDQGISFFGGIDPDSGVVVERGHELEGQSIAGKVLVFPSGKGSTVGSYTLYRLRKAGLAPLAIINRSCETITAVGAIIAEIPCVDQIDIRRLRSGFIATVDGDKGTVDVLRPAHLPAMLCGNEAGSFAEVTMSKRLPEIARKLAMEPGRGASERVGLLRLAEEMPETPVRLLEDPGAPDEALWKKWLAPYFGRNWLDTPWFPAETYFFRRILESTGYFQPGKTHGVDPYLRQKRNSLKEVVAQLIPTATRLEQVENLSHDDLTRLLHTLIWGNQADLSVWPAGSEAPTNHQEQALTAHLLVDQAAEAAATLFNESPRLRVVDFILDNVGLELAYDLLLADLLLSRRLIQQVRFHAKFYPTYVSDATEADIREMIAEFSKAEATSVREMGKRLNACLCEGSLRMLSDISWISPLAVWEMPETTKAVLAEADLLISKGDANYRRWVGDRHWAFDMPAEEVMAYRPAPLLLLRVLKSEVVVGLRPGQAEAMDAKDPEWMFNGNWGLIQFIP